MCPVAPKRPAAFSLVELVVVIGIVVIVAGLLLAVTARVRVAAARAACANNLRQIGSGLVVYDQEFGGLPGSDAHKSISDLPSFVDVLTGRRGFPAGLFICPGSGLDRPTSYELNFDVVGQPYAKGRADVVLAYEAGTCVQCHEGSTRGVGHGSMVNHLFFDGHVEGLRRPGPPPMPPAAPTKPRA